MRSTGNRERILEASIGLFNSSGTVAITTNHIATHLGISPGNLYFHFRNKEQVLTELFDRMCAETYAAWNPTGRDSPQPLELVAATFEVFFKYRFFHREMYHLRRKDAALAAKWRSHLSRTMRLLSTAYRGWTKSGTMRRIDSKGELRMVTETVLIASSWFLQFYESREKPATRRPLRQGMEHIMWILLPYCHEPWAQEIREFLNSTSLATVITAPVVRLPSHLRINGEASRA